MDHPIGNFILRYGGNSGKSGDCGVQWSDLESNLPAPVDVIQSILIANETISN
jgi:hypothetical protein